MVPFQIAYAVSIHKAQGLEYDSVKIIITDDIDELITHSIFYTAITRAREKLKIYWTQSVEKKVLDRIKPKNNHQDISLLKQELLLRKWNWICTQNKRSVGDIFEEILYIMLCRRPNTKWVHWYIYDTKYS